MENEWEASYRLSIEQMRENDRYSYSLLDAQKRMIEDKMKQHWENQFIQSFHGGVYAGDGQRVEDITGRTTTAVLEGLDFTAELVLRVSNVIDITQLSYDIRRSCVHEVCLKFERQQNRLDIYFEKAQDYVLVKMFTE